MGEVGSIQIYFGFLEFFNFAKPLNKLFGLLVYDYECNNIYIS